MGRGGIGAAVFGRQGEQGGGHQGVLRGSGRGVRGEKAKEPPTRKFKIKLKDKYCPRLVFFPSRLIPFLKSSREPWTRSSSGATLDLRAVAATARVGSPRAA